VIKNLWWRCGNDFGTDFLNEKNKLCDIVMVMMQKFIALDKVLQNASTTVANVGTSADNEKIAHFLLDIRNAIKEDMMNLSQQYKTPEVEQIVQIDRKKVFAAFWKRYTELLSMMHMMKYNQGGLKIGD
jgi:hypothetical protein